MKLACLTALHILVMFSRPIFGICLVDFDPQCNPMTARECKGLLDFAKETAKVRCQIFPYPANVGSSLFPTSIENYYNWASKKGGKGKKKKQPIELHLRDSDPEMFDTQGAATVGD